MSKQDPGAPGLSRRGLLKAGAVSAATAVSAASALTSGSAEAHPWRGGGGGGHDAGDDDDDLVLVNGRIHTMDGSNRVVRSVVIRNGRFAYVGNDVRIRAPG